MGFGQTSLISQIRKKQGQGQQSPKHLFPIGIVIRWETIK